MTASETLILGTYFFVLVILAVYGWHRYYLVYLYMKNKGKQPVPAGPLGALPAVTIQLPIYNEMYVADRLIDAVCLLDYPRELLEENKWLALRYGLEGELIDLPSSRRVPTSEIARRLVDRLRPHARELGSERELGGIESLIERGTGSRRQLDEWHATHDLRLIVEKIAASTARPFVGSTGGDTSTGT